MLINFSFRDFFNKLSISDEYLLFFLLSWIISLNFSFPDAVRELANLVGVKISSQSFEKNKQDGKIYEILEISTKWFEQNVLSWNGLSQNGYGVCLQK